MNSQGKQNSQVVRVNGVLKEVITVYDKSGKVLHKAMRPLMLEFRPRDLLQVIVGSTLLAVPVAFTEEVWMLGKELPLINVAFISLISLFFIGLFVYYNFYRRHFKGHVFEFVKRTFAIYLMSFLVAAVFLTLLEQAPWDVDVMLAMKRSVLVALPASMSAAVADMLK